MRELRKNPDQITHADNCLPEGLPGTGQPLSCCVGSQCLPSHGHMVLKIAEGQECPRRAENEFIDNSEYREGMT